jgi:HSP20 family protein
LLPRLLEHLQTDGAVFLNPSLTIAGERATDNRKATEGARQYAQERFNGSFRRVIELPQQADPDKVQAKYVDGCLLISVGKRETSKPRSITVQ